LDGLVVVKRMKRRDERGFLERIYCNSELEAAGFGAPPVQINRTLTVDKGVARGLHYQIPPHAEKKLVSCLRGRVFDVAVDLRRNSPTFLQWHGEELSDENGAALAIPEGFAHGFQTLEENCEMLYLHSAAYAPHAEAGCNLLDKRLNIAWPLPIKSMSDRDAVLPSISDVFEGV